MPHVTAQPPSTYVPSRERAVFKQLLADIHACDEKNDTHTPSTTLLLILAAARRLGVDPAELVNENDD